MFGVLTDSSRWLVRRRTLVALPTLAVALGLPIAGLSAVHTSPGTASQRPAVTIGESVMAAAPPDASPSADPSPSPQPSAAFAASPVHLPLLNFAPGDAGPAPAPRPGSQVLVPSVGLHVGVVDYSDCSGGTPMTRSSAVHFLCTPTAVTTFVGHNPGVFTPLLQTHTGDRVYFQHDGIQETWVIAGRYRVSPQEAASYTQDGSYVHAVFATCAEPDSSAYWIFTATPIGSAAPPSKSAQAGQGPSGPPGGGPTRPAPSPSPSPSTGPGSSLPGGVTIPPPPPI